MRRLVLSQVLPRRDAAHKEELKRSMRARLRDEARRKGLKPTRIHFSEHYEEFDGGAFTLLIIDARMDVQ
jgi:hypothetical protein